MDTESLRMKKVKEALIYLQLNPTHFDVVKAGPSANAPYHNASHCFTVAINCLEGANYYKMNLEEQRSLFLAGLYHDYDHSVGTFSDDVNIARAVRGMSYWLHDLERLSEDQDEDEEIEKVASIIRGTIWPSELYEGERNMYQKIICDADHMQWLEDDAAVFMDGLNQETGKVNTPESTCEFLKRIGVKTEWAVERMKVFGCQLKTT